MNNKPLDILGNEILVGDKVMFMQINYRCFMEGIVKSLSSKSALIVHERTNTCRQESRQAYTQIISLSGLKRSKVPVVHGRWELMDCHPEADIAYVCSNCKEAWVLLCNTPAENNMNYCPRCGTKMDLEEDNAE